MEKKMTWKEALEHAKQGKKIRKVAWKSGDYVALDLETFRWSWHDNIVWSVGNGDFTDKWELYEEEKPKSAWKCCREEPPKHWERVVVRNKTLSGGLWVGNFPDGIRLNIYCVLVADPENYEYCELPE